MEKNGQFYASPATKIRTSEDFKWNFDATEDDGNIRNKTSSKRIQTIYSVPKLQGSYVMSSMTYSSKHWYYSPPKMYFLPLLLSLFGA